MQTLDTAIAYYLCGIMVILALIIAIGAGRQHNKTQRSQQESLPERKD